MLPLIGSEMREKLPSSRARMFARMSPFDVTWVGVSPVLAFLLRDGMINRLDVVLTYSCVALAISVLVFQWFRISSPIDSFFSMYDALTLSRACLTAIALTAVIVFIFTRLEDAPRSIPVIHLLVLLCGLVGFRGWNQLSESQHRSDDHQPRCEDLDCIIVVGANRMALLFSKMLEEHCARDMRIIGIVDERPQLTHRTVNGHSIIGVLENLATIIDEYATHGVGITKVVVALDPARLSSQTEAGLRATCQARGIQIEWLHQIFSVPRPSTLRPTKAAEDQVPEAAITSGPYWSIKRLIDIVAASTLIVILLPLIILIAGLVLIDSGTPIVFWQQRIGHRGRPLRIFKFRTMRNSFDGHGRPVPDSERLSQLGRLLRLSRLDEIPQLINVLTGDMSLIGPRPLLPVDQPKNVRLRLHVRPGLTGLAQINGGTSLSAEEKDALDEWYIRRTSLLLDLKIMLRTIRVLVYGNPRNDTQISAALAERYMSSQGLF